MALGMEDKGEASTNRKSRPRLMERICLTNVQGKKPLAMQPLLCLGIRSLGCP
jgi:hypothetical protein